MRCAFQFQGEPVRRRQLLPNPTGKRVHPTALHRLQAGCILLRRRPSHPTPLLLLPRHATLQYRREMELRGRVVSCRANPMRFTRCLRRAADGVVNLIFNIFDSLVVTYTDATAQPVLSRRHFMTE